MDLDKAELLGADADNYEKVPDTLDVWFDSGSTHASVVDARPEFNGKPADMYLKALTSTVAGLQRHPDDRRGDERQGSLQPGADSRLHRGWSGPQMSKSIGNVVSPQDVMNKLGADILRLWVASTDYTGEMTVSDEILKRPPTPIVVSATPPVSCWPT